jgi:hypothetical protein
MEHNNRTIILNPQDCPTFRRTVVLISFIHHGTQTLVNLLAKELSPSFHITKYLAPSLFYPLQKYLT